ncbi:MAG: DUF951 domain-containing protein [Anaerolineae bacterium]
MREPMDLRVGDVVELRKPHPCGGKTWLVLRVGLDIGIECLTCRRYVLVPRRRFESSIKRFIERGPLPSDEAPSNQALSDEETTSRGAKTEGGG